MEHILDQALFERTCDTAQRTFYPNGIPAYGDMAKVRYRIIVATLEVLRQQGVFDGDPRTVAEMATANPALI